MSEIRFVPYTQEDNATALLLESHCVQGRSIKLRFQRSTFHRRSEVFKDYEILCAKLNDNLVGICAWAKKLVLYRNELARTIYGYDLRVHPAYRGQGVAKGLARSVDEIVGKNADCMYTLIAGENSSALGLAQHLYGTTLTVPLTYTIIPVYKKLKENKSFRFVTPGEIHKSYLKLNYELEFVPEFDEERLSGHVKSIAIGTDSNAGCSIWSNEGLLEEQVVGLARNYQIQRRVLDVLRPFVKLPRIPKPGHTIRSWFLYDLFAANDEALNDLLSIVNNLALNHEREFIYVLLQDTDPLLSAIRRLDFRKYKLPYFLLAKGRVCPLSTEKLYIDIRDL